jgi:CPA1 family monovalent cation:H+ antiporter
MRGVVSLAAALALPVTIADGTPFPGRDLILFLTFVVIFATLVLQGLSLPYLIRYLGVEDDGLAEKEERDARLLANRSALEQLTELASPDATGHEAAVRLRVEYEDQILQLQSKADDATGGSLRLFSAEYERLSREALQVERRTILRLRNDGAINDNVLRRIQRDIDLAEARLQHHG